MTDTPVSGTQYSISHGEYRAEIASVGASLRELTHAGRHLVAPFAADVVRPFYRGASLAPWPNRVVDGRYTFDGTERQLALTEPERGHALHGLATWLDFTPTAQADDRVTLTAEIVPQIGYPHRIALEVTYSLAGDGLTQTIRATNLGPGAAPYGCSAHPYLVAGPGLVDDWTLELPASDLLEVTDDRLIPTGRASVAEASQGSLDFRVAHPIGDTFIDHAYTGLAAPGGTATVRLTTGEGTGVALAWDAATCPWVQVHTGDRPEPENNRVGLAVEPMTCPPDAFNSGDLLIVLDPDASHEAGWRIEAIG